MTVSPPMIWPFARVTTPDFKPQGFGKTVPVAPNTNAAGRPKTAVSKSTYEILNTKIGFQPFRAVESPSLMGPIRDKFAERSQFKVESGAFRTLLLVGLFVPPLRHMASQQTHEFDETWIGRVAALWCKRQPPVRCAGRCLCAFERQRLSSSCH